MIFMPLRSLRRAVADEPIVAFKYTIRLVTRGKRWWFVTRVLTDAFLHVNNMSRGNASSHEYRYMALSVSSSPRLAVPVPFPQPLAQKFGTRCSLHFYSAFPAIALAELFLSVPSLAPLSFDSSNIAIALLSRLSRLPPFFPFSRGLVKKIAVVARRSAFTLSIVLLSDPPYISELLRARGR